MSILTFCIVFKYISYFPALIFGIVYMTNFLSFCFIPLQFSNSLIEHLDSFENQLKLGNVIEESQKTLF